MNRQRVRAAVFGLASIAWICVMTWFSMQPGEESGALSGKIVNGLLGWLLARGADAGKIEFLVRKLAILACSRSPDCLRECRSFPLGEGAGR